MRLQTTAPRPEAGGRRPDGRGQGSVALATAENGVARQHNPTITRLDCAFLQEVPVQPIRKLVYGMETMFWVLDIPQDKKVTAKEKRVRRFASKHGIEWLPCGGYSAAKVEHALAIKTKGKL